MTSNTSGKAYDLFGFGIAAVDDLIEVPRFPHPGTKVEILGRRRQGGGLCATALVAAARLGVKCMYGGFLGRNELSDFTRTTLHNEGIDVLEEVVYPDAEPFHSVILVDHATGERTILYSREKVVAPWARDIRADLIKNSRALFVDHFAPDGTIQACKIARRFGIPVVADIENANEAGVRDVIALTDHLIVPIRLAIELTGANDIESVVFALSQQRACTAVTDGARGCWYIEGGKDVRVKHQPAFTVEVVDTTGCGDVFHGAYIAALLTGSAIPEAIRFAGAAAAIKATQPGGQQGIPDRPTVEMFLRDQ
ncbi:MAG: PfkB family carbohydrate kinase [Candidatus Hydrogenedentes bacterium]|nr:PfkB family carbohydrate kinase [Candidatus Hydrogenedentota bacterium]